MNLKNRANALTKKTAPKHRKLELKLDVELRLGNGVQSTDYFGSNDLCKIKIEKTLVSTSDTKFRDLKSEILSSFESQFDELEKLLDNSSHLSDGFWSELSKTEGYENDAF